MKRILFRTISYFLFWVLFFEIGRIVFLLYHASKTASLTALEIGKVLGYGLRMDFSFAAYLSVIPFLLFLNEVAFRKKIFLKIAIAFTYVLLPVVVVLLTIDLELYSAWGFRLDSTPLQYLNTPAEMLASTASAPVWLLALIFISLTLLGWAGFTFLRRKWETSPKTSTKQLAGQLLLSLFLLALLVLPIRGGWQQIPLNQSDVYFSQKVFANHAGVNVPWNVMHSVLKKNHNTKNPYLYMEEQQAQALVQELYTPKSDTVPSLLRVQKPNVLFIILESYTAKFIGALGGPPEVTPNFNALAKEGILFQNIYAAGDRSEKGMVALLSGYPVQTTTSIIKTPKKTERLPQLASELKGLGYHTSYYYGGELAFANIKSYLINGQYDRLVEKSDFGSEHYNSKWGVHDHILFDKVLADHQNPAQPFLTTIFTLSSHEPYDVPIPAKFPGTEEETQFKNSFYYTDWALGRFIAAAKKMPLWQNTLVVLVADHGHHFPGRDQNDAPSKFRIPLLLTGGALAVRDTVVTIVGSQTDIVPTLLQQMGQPTHHFGWSKNLLDAKATPFAFYVFNDGFGMVTPNGTVTFDNVAKRPILRDPGVSDKQVEQGKAYMQTSFGDFLKK
ncbi:LTA synthase family protein [Rufibacter glacialis]|uniref:LTA synthase family protein n=1 Tax=Rufibacter glacialis TaxID=1259555 RepID=A0A5M8QHB7_9BACT|nr:alkaline phosphatase family protein [Rufibacter glacialis]KAA6434374.1 sulfatase-like hydrolase/transferase [Rufibacter glacialis]GGK68970.1 sulfatase [Rufibacter glacialis]